MGTTPVYALVMTAAGIGIPIMAAMNARIGNTIASPGLAVLFLLIIACVTMTAWLVATGFPAITLPDLPVYYALAGCLFVFYILSITWVAPKFGLGNAVFFVLFGQLIASAVIDQFGLFGAPQASLDLKRWIGIGFMVAGVFLARKTV